MPSFHAGAFVVVITFFFFFLHVLELVVRHRDDGWPHLRLSYVLEHTSYVYTA
jgi:hypothetical protein